MDCSWAFPRKGSSVLPCASDSFKQEIVRAPVTSSTSRALVYGQNQSPSANVLGANDRIGVAIIGLSTACGTGFHVHTRQIQSNARQNNTVVIAICDLF